MPRPIGAICDDVEFLLNHEIIVPTTLVAELMAALPRQEREKWLGLLAAMAWRPGEVTS